MLSCQSDAFAKVRPTNATDTSFPIRIPRTSEPTGPGVLDLATLSGRVARQILVVPYATGAENGTFRARLLGWRKLVDLWIPLPLAEVEATLGGLTGVASGSVGNNERFADTLTAVLGNEGVSLELLSNANDLVACFVADLKGFARVELLLVRGLGPSDVNALYSLL